METFIKLTKLSGKDVWLNVGAIVWFASLAPGEVGSRIVVGTPEDLFVKETPDQVLLSLMVHASVV